MKLTYEKPNFKVVTLEANFLATCLLAKDEEGNTIRTNSYGWEVCPIKLADGSTVFSTYCSITEYECADSDSQPNSNTFGS